MPRARRSGPRSIRPCPCAERRGGRPRRSGVAVRPSKRRRRTTGDRKIPRGSRVPSDPCTNPEMVEAYRPLGEHGGAARRGPHVHPPPRGRDVDWGSPSGGIPEKTRVKNSRLSVFFSCHSCFYRRAGVISGYPVRHRDKYSRIQSAFPRTSARAPYTRVEHDVGFRSERFHDRRVHVRSRASPDPPRPRHQGECPIRISVAHIPRDARSIARTLTNPRSSSPGLRAGIPARSGHRGRSPVPVRRRHRQIRQDGGV